MGSLRRQEAKRLLKNLHKQGDFDADTWLDRLTDALAHTPEVVNVCARRLALWNEEVKEELKFTATPEASYGAIAEVVLDAAAVYNGEPTDQDEVDGWRVGDEVQWTDQHGLPMMGVIDRINSTNRTAIIDLPSGGWCIDVPMGVLKPVISEAGNWHIGDKVQWHNSDGELRIGTIARIYLDSRAVVIKSPEGGYIDKSMDSLIPAVPEPSTTFPMPYKDIMIALQQAEDFLRGVASGRTNRTFAEIHASRLSRIIATMASNAPPVGNDG